MPDDFEGELASLSGRSGYKPAWHSWPADVRDKIAEAIGIYDRGGRVSKQGLVRWLETKYPDHQITGAQVDCFARQYLSRRSWSKP